MNRENSEAIEAYLNKELSFDDLKTEIGEEEAEAVRESEKQLSQAENLAEELSKL